jgi:hypothetical protein
MTNKLRDRKIVIRITKSTFYMSVRRHFPMPELKYLYDSEKLEGVRITRIDCPED